MLTVGQSYFSDICDWPCNKRFWHFCGFWGWFFLWGEIRGRSRLKGSFCSAERVFQKFVFDALSYMIITYSLILHVCHGWHKSGEDATALVLCSSKWTCSSLKSYGWLCCICKDILYVLWTCPKKQVFSLLQIIRLSAVATQLMWKFNKTWKLCWVF